MSDGYEIGGRYREDPIGSRLERGRSRSLSQQKSGRDLGLTPSEQRQKAVLMRQFMRNPEGETNSVAYRESPCWCDCGRHLRGESGLCSKCEAAFARGDLG